MALPIVLRITGPDGAEKELPLDAGDGVTIGSGPSASVRIDDPAVSALHCLVKVRGDELTVVDLASEGGSFLGERRIEGAGVVLPGTVLRLGRTSIAITLPSQPRPPPCPDAAPPTETEKELEVAMLWGGSLLEVQRFAKGCTISVGTSASDAFRLESDAHPLGFRLAEWKGECLVTAPDHAKGQLEHADGTVLPLLGRQPLELGDRARVSVGAIAFEIRWRRPSPSARRSGWGVDFTFARAATLSALAGAAVFAAFSFTDLRAEPLSETLAPAQGRFVHLFDPTPKRIALKLQALKKEPTKPDERRFDKPQKDSGGLASKREDDHAKVMHTALLDLLGGPGGSTSNVFSPGLSPTIADALGSVKGTAATDSGGVGGIGSRTLGPGGGPSGLGIGIGRIGGGHGPDTWRPGVGLKHKGGTPPREPIRLTANCERFDIGRVISRHANAVRYCYEAGLSRDPSMAGKVALTFTIGPTGAVIEVAVAESTLHDDAVEGCIVQRVRQWKFGEPKGGGVCIVNYPWVLRSAGSGDEE